jgi:hypothetical protein
MSPSNYIFILLFLIFFSDKTISQESSAPIKTIQLTNSITPIPDSLQKRTVVIQMKDTSYTIEVNERFLSGMNKTDETSSSDEPNWFLIIGLLVFVGAMIYNFLIKPWSKSRNNSSDSMVGDSTDVNTDDHFFHHHSSHDDGFGDGDDGGADSD